MLCDQLVPSVTVFAHHTQACCYWDQCGSHVTWTHTVCYINQLYRTFVQLNTWTTLLTSSIQLHTMSSESLPDYLSVHDQRTSCPSFAEIDTIIPTRLDQKLVVPICHYVVSVLVNSNITEAVLRLCVQDSEVMALSAAGAHTLDCVSLKSHEGKICCYGDTRWTKAKVVSSLTRFQQLCSSTL